MAPPPLPLRHYAPSHVTEDTPPDLLEGTMDLEVTLPNGKSVVMTVHRSTPMMDLLIQVTTAHRINPGGHVIQVVSDNIFLSYKPSTPIGTLDTNAIKIVAKNSLNEKAKARKLNLQQQAIERNIRLKPKEWVFKQQLVVNLPRNQLAVYRVPPKSLISDVFAMVCEDKSLDPETHEIRHPVNVDERLRGSCSLSDYQLQEVCIVSSDFRPPPLSVTDLITMSSIAHPEDKKRSRGFLGLFARKAKSSTGDSSVSSGSAGERSVSPARSDESVEGGVSGGGGVRTPQGVLTPASSSATLTNADVTNHHYSSTMNIASGSSSRAAASTARLSRPVSTISLNKTKKRQAPVPPQRVKRPTDSRAQNGKVNGTCEKKSLSRHSSDSSGYHEPEIRSSHTSPSGSEVGSFEASRISIPPSNLTTVSSLSTLSVSSTKSGKRKAPSPPKILQKPGPEPTTILESPEETTDPTQCTKTSNESSTKISESKISEGSLTPNCREGDTKNLPESNGDVRGESEVVKENGLESHPLPEESKNMEFTKEEEVEVNDHTMSNTSTLSSNCSHKENSIETENVVKSRMDSLESDSSMSEKSPVEDVTNEAHILEPAVDPLVDKSSVNSTNTSCAVESKPTQSSGSAVSENEEQTRTVSLSSETSSTSVEMLNPKDIQRPRRQRRKKIPEEFMKASDGEQDVPDSSNSPESLENLERVEGLDVEKEVADTPNGVFEEREELRTIERDTPDLHVDGPEEYESTPSLGDDGWIKQEVNSSEGDDATSENSREVVTDDEERNGELKVRNMNTTISKVELNSNVTQARTAKLSVVYVEDANEEESSTDPVSPRQERRTVYTSKVQLITEGNLKENRSASDKDSPSLNKRSVTVTPINDHSVSTSAKSPKMEVRKEDVIAELKSAIGSSDEVDSQPRILNCKPKEKKEWTCGRPSDYNLILSFKKSDNNSSTNGFIPRTDSTSSYDSADNGSLKKSRSSTEASYESAPPPPPDCRPPLQSDSDSKASSSVVSRQSSFGENDGSVGSSSSEFVKPRVPAFSISTYQSRASKVSYDKKLARSESLASFKDFQTPEEVIRRDDDVLGKVAKSDNQRNEAFRSDELLKKKKSTSTTFLNLVSSTEWSDGTQNDSNIRPSLLKSRSKCSLNESCNNSRTNSLKRPKEGRVQLEISSAKENEALNRPLWKNYTNLRKAKSNLDVRGGGGDERMEGEGVDGIPDSGLANEYMRLQDDFMKWQQQLLQNQQLLHSRVAPIAANPPTLNNAGRIGGGLRLGWKTATPWIVTNLNQQSSNAATAAPAANQQPRKPVEINIPIRLVDSDDDDASSKRAADKSQPKANEKIKSFPAGQSGSGARWTTPNVPVESWQERPSFPGGRAQQPGSVDSVRPVGNQPRMQMVFQSAPQGREGIFNQMTRPGFQQEPQSNIQQGPQPSFQHVPQSSFQQIPQPSFQQVPQSTFQQIPQSTFQQVPQSGFQQVPQSSFQQVPQSNFQQVPQPNIQQVPQSNFQQVPQPRFQQVPQPGLQNIPQTNFQQGPQTTFQQTPQSNFQQEVQPNFQETRQRFQPDLQQISKGNFQQTPEPNQQVPFGPRVVNQKPNQNLKQQFSDDRDKGDDNINARFSSVVTLSNDNNGQNVPQKDKVRSIVQLNNSENVQGRPWGQQQQQQPQPQPPPFQSKIIGGVPKSIDESDRGVSPSVAPMSSRLVQQASQQQPASGGFRVSPPKFEQSSFPRSENRYAAPRTERYTPPKGDRFSPVKQSSPPKAGDRSSPQKQESPPPPPFASVKLRPVDSTSRVSPPKISSVPQPPAPPPPPPPPSAPSNNFGPPPPPPPPPQPMSEEDRRTATGKKIFAAANVPQLDAREELMMAIRQFGGSGNLRKSGRPPPR